MKHPKLAFAATLPRDTVQDASFAAAIVIETRATLAVMPTGPWRRSLRERLDGLEGMLDAWPESRPSEDERKRLTAHAIHFFCDVKGPGPVVSGSRAPPADPSEPAPGK